MLQYTILDRVKKPFVIYKDTMTNKVCLEPRQGRNKQKSIVISLPHAGVHMVQEIFQNIGLQHVRVQLDKNNIGDYRFLSDQDRIEFARMNDTYSFALADTHKWIIDGQFSHCKLPYDDNSYLTLRESGITMYLLKRDLRDCIVSHARQKQRDNVYYFTDNSKLLDTYITTAFPNEMIKQFQFIVPWFEHKTFDVLSYETLVGQLGRDEQYQCLIKLQEDFEIKGITMDEIINSSIGVPTFTYTKEPSSWKKYWNDNIETWYAESGLKKMNEILGYES